MRGLQDRIAMGREVAVTLVIGEDDDDVRAGLSWIPRAAASRQGNQCRHGQHKCCGAIAMEVKR